MTPKRDTRRIHGAEAGGLLLTQTIPKPTVNIPTINIPTVNIPTVKTQTNNMRETQKTYKKDTPLARHSHNAVADIYVYIQNKHLS